MFMVCLLVSESLDLGSANVYGSFTGQQLLGPRLYRRSGIVS